MRKKRFSHHVDIFCAMFCGWKLTNSYDRIAELGSGEYEIDILSDACKKDGALIPPLSIVGELAAWFKEDLAKSGIAPGVVSIARLNAKLVIKQLEGKRRTNVIFPGREEARYVCCQFECESLLKSGNDHYTAKKVDYQEWPHPLSRPSSKK